jgi:zinc transporter ZupT
MINPVDGNELVNILLLSLIAGLGTSLGGLIAITRNLGKRSFGFLMGITAGVMISLAFMELVNHAWELAGPWLATMGFGLGAFAMFLIDFFIPHMRFGEKEEHSHELGVEGTGVELLHHRRRRRRHASQENRIIDRKLMVPGSCSPSASHHNLRRHRHRCGLSARTGFVSL